LERSTGRNYHAAFGSGFWFDPREFAWIGSPASETAVCEDWYTSPVKTFEQARQQELIMGSTAKGADLTGFLPPLIKLAGA